MMNSIGILPVLMLLPLIFAGVVAVLPARRAGATALAGTLLALVLGVVAACQFRWAMPEVYQFTSELSWIPRLGLTLSWGVDSVAMLLVLLTLLLGPICVLCSKTAVQERVKTYYAWLLILQAAMTGVFCARDVLLFYICFEFTLLPMYVLISLYGSTNRQYAAIKFFLFTFTGSIVALAGLLYVAWTHAHATGQWTLAIDPLAATARAMPGASQAWVLAALLAGFAVKVPLFPVHTWLPLAHTEAPTAGSVILAGVLLKLGTYGLFRFAVPFAPAAFAEHAPLIAGVCVVGILYGGLICWVQTDVKKLVAYSSVAHLGFCVLGLAALNVTGITGSVMYMINHGLSTGALFLLIGMVYERYHTRSMKELGGLAARMPIWATFMVFFTMSSVGLPGLNGFVSEFLCLMGVFQAGSAWGVPASGGSVVGSLGPWYAAIAGSGMIVAAMYLLWMVGRVVFGPLVEPHAHDHHHHNGHGRVNGSGHAGPLPVDLNAREILTLAPLAVLCLVLGLRPTPVLAVIETPAQNMVELVRGQVRAVPPADSPEARP